MGNNNIYNYKIPKSGNEEIGFFNTKGRITRMAFFLRLLFGVGLYAVFTVLYVNDFFGDAESRSFIFFETIYLYVLPFFVLIFILIQGAKRMHDVNKSGWYFFIPLQNIYLIFSPGSKGNNNYGIDPSPTKNIQYFDEIESSIDEIKESESDTDKKSGLDKWRAHLNYVKKSNPSKTHQEILEIARNTYKVEKSTTNKSTVTSKKKANTYLFFLIIAIVAVLYYVNIFEPSHYVPPPTVNETFPEVTIGEQVWMSKNLNVNKFRNGDVIPEAKTEAEWITYCDAGKAAWCYYDNDRKNAAKYGKLYNWYAVNDPRGLAPEGWHVPSDEEWTELTDYLGGVEKAGARMKSKTGWTEDGNGTNSSGFSGVPGGTRLNGRSFIFVGEYGYWWSSTEESTNSAWRRNLGYINGEVNRNDSNKRLGFSVRCLRD